jgi:hypothetical protein
MSSHERTKQFLSGTFHEDWNLEHRSFEEAVAQYSSGQSAAEERVEVARHLERLLEVHDERSLRAVLFHAYGCYYDPGPEAGAMQRWLRAIVKLLRRG